jgi:hypothetical protein
MPTRHQDRGIEQSSCESLQQFNYDAQNEAVLTFQSQFYDGVIHGAK